MVCSVSVMNVILLHGQTMDLRIKQEQNLRLTQGLLHYGITVVLENADILQKAVTANSSEIILKFEQLPGIGSSCQGVITIAGTNDLRKIKAELFSSNQSLCCVTGDFLKSTNNKTYEIANILIE